MNHTLHGQPDHDDVPDLHTQRAAAAREAALREQPIVPGSGRKVILNLSAEDHLTPAVRNREIDFHAAMTANADTAENLRQATDATEAMMRDVTGLAEILITLQVAGTDVRALRHAGGIQ